MDWGCVCVCEGGGVGVVGAGAAACDVQGRRDVACGVLHHLVGGRGGGGGVVVVVALHGALHKSATPHLWPP
jgi:hypothetical protein